MKKVIQTALCAVISLSLMTGCSSSEINITVAKVKTDANISELSYDGKISASESVSIIPNVSGKVSTVEKDLGAKVSKGDILFTIDDTSAKLQYQQAQAALSSAKASYSKMVGATNPQSESSANQNLERAENEMRDAKNAYENTKIQYDNDSLTTAAKSQYDTAAANYEKAKFLFDSGEESQFNLDIAYNNMNTAKAQYESAKSQAKSAMDSADSRLNNAKTSLEAAKQNYSLTVSNVNPENTKVAQAQVDSALAAADIAKKNLDDTKVTSPINGQVSMNAIKPGDIVSQQTSAMAVVNPSQMEMMIGVSDSYIDEIVKGIGTMQAQVMVSATGQTFTGIVSAASPGADVKTGLYPVKITFENKDGQMKDGMLASAKLIATQTKSKIYVPIKSVLNENGENYVYKLEDGKLLKVSVLLGEERNKYVEVNGLSATDEVVVEGIDKVSENGKFRIISSISNN